MREFSISAKDLQAAVGDTLRARFKRAGLQIVPSDGGNCTVMLPVNLHLVGNVEVICEEDGTWIFRQELEMEVADRVKYAEGAHLAAVVKRETPRCR